jgi:predicted GNAT family acetyltransferase
MPTVVARSDERSRYELLVDGELVGVADFRMSNGALVLPHTEIASAHRGRGFGARLVEGVLDDARERGERVVPQCWFVAEFIESHPEYRDLRAAS